MGNFSLPEALRGPTVHGDMPHGSGSTAFRVKADLVHIAQIHLTFSADTDVGPHTEALIIGLDMDDGFLFLKPENAYPPLLANKAAIEMVLAEARAYVNDPEVHLVWKFGYGQQGAWVKLLESTGWKKVSREDRERFFKEDWSAMGDLYWSGQ